ncbi:MAG: methionyl-tRNA formyltransferase [Phycisphaerales bacterium]|nr:MAG: methionyl-tRNA formyltransferase [Phycisphaerales bacterium]
MRILFVGSGAFALPTLEWLMAGDHEIAAVVTQPARPSGRGRRVVRTPVGAVAQDAGLHVISPENVNDPSVIDELRSFQAVVAVTIAFGQLLRPPVLAALPGGFINLHASLLPKYRGAAPINWAILCGEERTGVTVFRIDRRMDAGPILTSRWTLIKPEETASELHDRLAAIGVDAVRAALLLFEGGADPPGHPQDDTAATRAPKLSKADGAVDFSRPAGEVACRIRGLWSWPAASARFEASDGRWENVQLARARVAETDEVPDIPAGKLDDRLYVAAGGGFVELLEIKPASGKVMTWREYVNGRHVRAGDRLAPPD